MASYSHAPYETFSMFQLKASFYPLNVLQLLGADLSALEQQLNAKIAQAPKFFYHAPVIIDLQKISEGEARLDFQHLMDILTRKKLIPVGIKGANEAQQTAAIQAGFALLPDQGKERKMDPTVELTHPPAQPLEKIKGTSTKVIKEPVRSGQQIYAQGDLVIVAPISQGAEVLADGNIHVYGPLRGRALAGINGDESAHIFCQHLEPELISIAGQYKISEDIEPARWNKAAKIALINGRLHIQPL